MKPQNAPRMLLVCSLLGSLGLHTNPQGRQAILEKRVRVNGKLVTHTEVRIESGNTYTIGLFDRRSGFWQEETIQT